MFRFTLHRHKAKRAGKHDDLRLEKNKYVESFAIPKGLPLKKGVKRLAIMTERHPKSVLNFKGSIPKGEYGAGTLFISKKGTYDTIRRKGKVYIVELNDGKKQSRYSLVRTRPKQYIIQKI